MSKNAFAYFYGVPRSGSTLVRRVLYMLFPKKTITGVHEWEKTDKPVVVTYRDFRDILASYWRTSYGCKLHKLTPNEKEIRDSIRATETLILSLENCRKYYMGKENICWLRYEEFWNDYDFLFQKLKYFFKIKISKRKREQIISKTNLKYHKEIADNVIIENPDDVFMNWDSETEIHAFHIYTGKVGTWKEIIPKKYHDLINERLERYLKTWGYTI